MNYWLVKTEPNSYSIDDLAKDKKTHWSGVRNYQARNYMRDSMKIGDRVLFYHSNAEPPAVVGVAEVCSEPYPDATALDSTSHYYDPKATVDNPIWMLVDLSFVEKFPTPVGLPLLKQTPELEGMKVIQRGIRFSVQPVSKEHYEVVLRLGGSKS